MDKNYYNLIKVNIKLSDCAILDKLEYFSIHIIIDNIYMI